MVDLQELLIEAREELKRLEHIIYVSLKYTRTVDVLLTAIRRVIETYDLLIEILLEKAKEEGLITSIPKSPGLRATKLLEVFPHDNQLKKYLTFYSFLRTLLKKPHEKRNEYRRHVTLVVNLGDHTAEIDIDNLENCEKTLYQFFDYTKEKIKEIN